MRQVVAFTVDLISAFEALDPAERARVAVRASTKQLTTRRVVAPAEAMNAITVGSLHADQFTYPYPLPAYNLEVRQIPGFAQCRAPLGRFTMAQRSPRFWPRAAATMFACLRQLTIITPNRLR